MFVPSQYLNGSEIKEAREAANLTIRDAALIIHKSTREWAAWEQDTSKMPLGLMELFLIKTNQSTSLIDKYKRKHQ